MDFRVQLEAICTKWAKRLIKIFFSKLKIVIWKLLSNVLSLEKLLGKKETDKQKQQPCSATGLEKTNVLGQIIYIAYTKLLKSFRKIILSMAT